MEREYENLRAVLQWSLKQAPAKETGQRLILGLRLAGALRAFWVMRGLFREGLDFLERTLARGEGIFSASQRARALDQAGGLARFLGDKDRAEALLKESLRLRRELADARGIATTLLRLGMVATDRCDFPAARSLTEEALALFREQGTRHVSPGPSFNWQGLPTSRATTAWPTLWERSAWPETRRKEIRKGWAMTSTC